MSLLALADRLLATPEPPGPCAWLLHSNRLDRALWLLADREAEAALDPADLALPVLYVEELPELRGLDDATLHAVLDAKATFGPGTTVLVGAVVAEDDVA